MSDARRHLIRGFDCLNDFLVETSGLEVQRRPNVSILYFFNPPGPNLFPITTKTDINVEHYVTFTNALANFFNDL